MWSGVVYIYYNQTNKEDVSMEKSAAGKELFLQK